MTKYQSFSTVVYELEEINQPVTIKMEIRTNSRGSAMVGCVFKIESCRKYYCTYKCYIYLDLKLTLCPGFVRGSFYIPLILTAIYGQNLFFIFLRNPLRYHNKIRFKI